MTRHTVLPVALCALAICIPSHGEGAAQGAATASVLPRRPGAKNETYPGVEVLYSSISDGKGRLLREIVTRRKPRKADCRRFFLSAGLAA